MNRESGLLPQVYNLLIQPSVTSDSAVWPHLSSVYLSIHSVCASRVTVSLIIAHLFPNYHPVSCHVSVLKPGFCNTSLITDDDCCIVCRNVWNKKISLASVSCQHPEVLACLATQNYITTARVLLDETSCLAFLPVHMLYSQTEACGLSMIF